MTPYILIWPILENGSLFISILLHNMGHIKMYDVPDHIKGKEKLVTEKLILTSGILCPHETMAEKFKAVFSYLKHYSTMLEYEETLNHLFSNFLLKSLMFYLSKI